VVNARESREQHATAPEDAPLRADVRVLGTLVGTVVSEQRGEAFFETVEAVRRAAIARREGDENADRELRARLQHLGAEEAGELSEAAREEFQEAIDELETKVDRLRD
jgi:phosphoenolpyruvate carboxylase